MQDMVLMTVSGMETSPSLEQSAELLGVPASALDTEFGVVLVDPQRRIYTVRVDATHIESRGTSTEDSGPYSDPKIAPFGLPE